MDQLKGRAKSLLSILPPGQRVVAAAAAGVLLLAGIAFSRWVSTPSYSLLFGNLDDTTLSTVIDKLEADGIDYKIEGGGSRVLVPKSKVYELRAALAQEGVAGKTAPAGYELLDAQGISTSDFKQRVDYQRALEGELSRTLMAMNGISTATVRLAIPERSPFEEDKAPVTASVLVGSARTLSQSQVETIVFLVSSAVDGLEPSSVTVADATGKILAAPGDVGGASAGSDKSLRLTREYESTLAADIQNLLTTASGGSAASVSVRATLNFDKTEREQELIDPGSAVTVDERESRENLDGGSPGGAGLPPVSGGNDVNYEKTESDRRYAVSRQIVRTQQAPGDVEKLSIAIVMDDGSRTGVKVPSQSEVEQLVSAAVGLDTNRGDTIKVTQMAFPKAGDAGAKAAGSGEGDMFAMLPKAGGIVVLLLVAFTLFSMMMRGRKRSKEMTLDFLEATPVATNERRRELVGAGVAPGGLPPMGAPQALDGAISGASAAAMSMGIPETASPVATAAGDVMELVQRQPEEIAAILRAWLADRRR